MKLIVGLGNPGEKYYNTRHNVGFMTLESFLSENGFSWKKEEHDQKYSLLNLSGHRFIVLEPLTFMNESGRAVKYICDKFEIQPSNILVIRDDLDLPVGKIKIKIDHSAGGHNGVKDIMRVLNSKDFISLKIGIDHPRYGTVVDWVLGRFSSSELVPIEQAIGTGSNIISDFIVGDSPQELMNRYNGNENS